MGHRPLHRRHAVESYAMEEGGSFEFRQTLAYDDVAKDEVAFGVPSRILASMSTLTLIGGRDARPRQCTIVSTWAIRVVGEKAFFCEE